MIINMNDFTRKKVYKYVHRGGPNWWIKNDNIFSSKNIRIFTYINIIKYQVRAQRWVEKSQIQSKLWIRPWSYIIKKIYCYYIFGHYKVLLLNINPQWFKYIYISYYFVCMCVRIIIPKNEQDDMYPFLPSEVPRAIFYDNSTILSYYKHVIITIKLNLLSDNQ